jgi:phospholipase C
MEKKYIFVFVLIAVTSLLFLNFTIESLNYLQNQHESNRILQTLKNKEKAKFENLISGYKINHKNKNMDKSNRNLQISNPTSSLIYINTVPKIIEPNSKEKNDNFTVYFKTTNATLSSNSWIGIYPYGEEVGIFNCLNYFSINSNLRGAGKLTIPTSAGYYDVRYIQDNNLKALQTDGPILINPNDSYIKIINNGDFLKRNYNEISDKQENYNNKINLNFDEIKNLKNSKNLIIEWKIGGETLQNLISKSNSLNLNIKICLNIIGSSDPLECIWKKTLNKLEDLENKDIIDVPKFAGYFYFRIYLEKDPEIYEAKDTNLVVSEMFKISSDEFILIPDSLYSVIGSSITVNYFSADPLENDWIGFYKLSDIRGLKKSVTPIRSSEVIFENNYGNFTAFLPPNSQAGQFVFIYFRNQIPLSISDIIEVQQPKVTCLKKNMKNENDFILDLLNFNSNNTNYIIDLKEHEQTNKKNRNINSNSLTKSKIKHLVIICTENHSFDSYYGNYCEAEPFSNPKCNIGPKCCEKPPKTVDGFSPKILNDTQNMLYDPNHNANCELCEINNGKMNGYLKGCSCSSPDNFAVADKKTVNILHDYSKKYAMSDMYFQPSAGASSQNDMYFARGSYVFTDNRRIAIASIGSNCWYRDHYLLDEFQLYYDPTISSLLSQCNFTLRTYTEGYNFAKNNFTGNPCYPDGYDSADIPFNYYAGIEDKDNYITDYLQLQEDLRNKTLPEVSFIKPLGNRTGHPANGDISSELNFVKDTVDMILESEYRDDTLILYVPDESGGFYDHVTPPKTNIVDNVPYGPRIPFIAIGKFAKKNYISHTIMEHSSIIKFIEWNWLNGETGQLNTRDRNVNGIGDLIDPETAGTIVP